MKQLFLFLLFVGLSFQALKAQCVKGDCQNGYGEMYYNGTTPTSANPEYYKGDWKDGKYHGKGAQAGKLENYYYKYTGDFVNGMRQGKGVMTWDGTGTKYEGDFVEDLRSGYGIFSWANRGYWAGQWVKGNLTGKGKKLFSNGNSVEGTYANGVLADGFRTEYSGEWGCTYSGDGKGSRFINKVDLVFDNGYKKILSYSSTGEFKKVEACYNDKGEKIDCNNFVYPANSLQPLPSSSGRNNSSIQSLILDIEALVYEMKNYKIRLDKEYITPDKKSSTIGIGQIKCAAPGEDSYGASRAIKDINGSLFNYAVDKEFGLTDNGFFWTGNIDWLNFKETVNNGRYRYHELVNSIYNSPELKRLAAKPILLRPTMGIMYPSESLATTATNVFYLDTDDPFYSKVHVVLDYVGSGESASFPKGSYMIFLSVIYNSNYPNLKPFYITSKGVQATEAANNNVATANMATFGNARAKGKVPYLYVHSRESVSAIMQFMNGNNVSINNADLIFGVVFADPKESESMIIAKIPGSWKHNTGQAASVFANAAGSNAVQTSYSEALIKITGTDAMVSDAEFDKYLNNYLQKLPVSATRKDNLEIK